MKIFSVVKILQKVVKYFCSERCPRVQRIIWIFLRIFGARNIRVALELKGLARVLEVKMNIFHLRKIFQTIFLGLTRGEMMVGRRTGNTWVKIKGYPSG